MRTISTARSPRRVPLSTADWRKINATARGAILRKLADLITGEAERLAEIETTDNGKLIAEMRTQLKYIPQWFYYFGGLGGQDSKAASFPSTNPACSTSRAKSRWASSPPSRRGTRRSCSRRGSLRPPWPPETRWCGSLRNIRPSPRSNSASCSRRPDLPPGVVNIVTGFGSEVGEPLITHRHVAKIAFTGGDKTGEHVYGLARERHQEDHARAGRQVGQHRFRRRRSRRRGERRGLRHLRRHRPDLHRRLARADSSAQSTISSSSACSRSRKPRAWAIRSTPPRRSARSPRNRSTTRCSTTSASRRTKARSAASAATKRTRPECGSGWFVEPTIFTGVTPEMRIAKEEVFGPVLSVIPFDDEDEAVHIANDTIYGLAAGVWTTSMRRALVDVGASRSGHGVGEHLSRGELHVALRRLQALRHRTRERQSKPSANICRRRASGSTSPAMRRIHS